MTASAVSVTPGRARGAGRRPWARKDFWTEPAWCFPERPAESAAERTRAAHVRRFPFQMDDPINIKNQSEYKHNNPQNIYIQVHKHTRQHFPDDDDAAFTPASGKYIGATAFQTWRSAQHFAPNVFHQGVPQMVPKCSSVCSSLLPQGGLGLSFKFPPKISYEL